MGAVVFRNGDSHGARDLLIVFAMTGDAFHRIDMLDKDGVLWVLELSSRVRITESFERFPMTLVARGIGNARSREDVPIGFIVVADAALHFYLVMSMRRLAWQ